MLYIILPAVFVFATKYFELASSYSNVKCWRQKRVQTANHQMTLSLRHSYW